MCTKADVGRKGAEGKMKGLRRLVAEKRGAVAAEFVIAFMPLAITFFSFTQVGQLYTGHLVFKHAALAAGRAAITTVGPCNPGADKDHRRDPQDVQIAAFNALGEGAWQGHFASVQANATYGGGDQYGPVTTKTTARYHCTVPLGSKIVCTGGFVNMEEQVILPHQGANYDNASGCGHQ